LEWTIIMERNIFWIQLLFTIQLLINKNLNLNTFVIYRTCSNHILKIVSRKKNLLIMVQILLKIPKKMIKRKSSVKIKILFHHQHMSFKMSQKMINHQLKQRKNLKNIISI